MMQRDLLIDVGGFDESLPTCEYYDLWLRIGMKYPIYLIDEALVVKRGKDSTYDFGYHHLSTRSFRSFPHLKNGSFFGATDTCSPVLGFLPV